MHAQDRQAIEALFARLADIERNSAPRDPDAEAFIRARMSAQQGAPYFMAQTIVMQQQALEEAQRRIDALERAAPPRGAPEFRGTPERSSLFGSAGARGAPQPERDQPAGGRGGFLAGAVQTAMGVAGGVMLGNMLGGLFGGSRPAQAAPAEQAPPAEPAAAEDGGGVLDSWFGGDEEQ